MSPRTQPPLPGAYYYYFYYTILRHFNTLFVVALNTSNLYRKFQQFLHPNSSTSSICTLITSSFAHYFPYFFLKCNVCELLNTLNFPNDMNKISFYPSIRLHMTVKWDHSDFKFKLYILSVAAWVTIISINCSYHKGKQHIWTLGAASVFLSMSSTAFSQCTDGKKAAFSALDNYSTRPYRNYVQKTKAHTEQFLVLRPGSLCGVGPEACNRAFSLIKGHSSWKASADLGVEPRKPQRRRFTARGGFTTEQLLVLTEELQKQAEIQKSGQ